MDRKQTVQSLMQNMGTLGRAAMGRWGADGNTAKNMPTRAQIGVLFTVWHEERLSIKELAQKFSMSSSAATQLVNGLVKEGLLVRTEDKIDRRKITIALTAKGKKDIELLKKKRYQTIERLVSPLSDHELEQLKIISEKIAKNLKTIWTKNHR
ncbi:MAG: MarR family transcriptional regulator [Candidatus Doudnabacteria bacterium]|nr:MarR family transcriptional regulator [Candidatus Doudnabacteria bacterium]